MGNIEVQSKENYPNNKINQSQKKTSQKQQMKVLRTQSQYNQNFNPPCRAVFHKMGPLIQEVNFIQDIEETLPQNLQNNELEDKQTGNQPSMFQQLMNENQQKIGRIEVHWSLFVKIKKKNFLQDYVFIKQLGRGAYGSVAKIKMKYGSQCRAVKIIKQSVNLKDAVKRQKLYAQISIPIELDHPNIAKLYQVFQYKKNLSLVMELCQGGDLFTYIKNNGKFTQNHAAGFMKQIMSGVYYMHKKGVCHRDLKPQNMLYDNQSGLLKIIDFGTATKFVPGTILDAMVGTPYYVAPQVINKKYNQKCDIWSCGIILYVILSGNPPFHGKNQKQILQKIRLQPVSFNHPIWNKRSTLCKQLIINMLSKDPDNRFSAQQVLNSSWIQKSIKQDAESLDIGPQIASNLRNFHFQNKLKAVVYTYIASQLYSNKDKQKLMRAFQSIDKDGDGVIQRDQLLKIFDDVNSPLNMNQVEAILALIDTNGSGRIDFTQFLVAASNQQQLLKKKQLQSAFAYLDADHSGYITFQQVRAFLDGTQETGQEIKKIFQQVDDNGDGQISKSEFVALLLGVQKAEKAELEQCTTRQKAKKKTR